MSTVCLFSKVLAGYMFFKTNSSYGIIYAIVCLGKYMQIINKIVLNVLNTATTRHRGH